MWCEPQVSPLIDSENQAEMRKGKKRVQGQSKIELMGKYWLRSQLSTAAQLEIQHRAAAGFGRNQEWYTRHKSEIPESLLFKWLSPHRIGEEPLLSFQPLFWSGRNFRDELRYCSILCRQNELVSVGIPDLLGGSKPSGYYPSCSATLFKRIASDCRHLLSEQWK